MAFLFIAFILVKLLLLTLSVRADKRIMSVRIPRLKNPPFISVIIPCYKSGQVLSGTLESIRSSGYPKKEIIVVNDGSDPTVSSVCRNFSVKEVKNFKRIGKGMSLNKGVKYAKGKYILFLDSDTTLSGGVLKTLLGSYTAYEKLGDNIGMMGPAFTARNRKNIFSVFSDFEQAMHRNIIKMQMNFRSIISTRGCCLLLTKEAFCRSGGFSKTLIEDGDLSAKMFKTGYNIKYEPRAVVKTSEPETFNSLIQSKRRYGKGTFYCAIKHRIPYLGSLQAFTFFYPFPLLTLAFFALFIFHNFISPVHGLLSLMLLGTNSSASFLVTAIAIIAAAAIFSVLESGLSKYAQPRTTIRGSIRSFVIFSALLLPVAYAYLRGAVSGIVDKIRKKPELIFSDW